MIGALARKSLDLVSGLVHSFCGLADSSTQRTRKSSSVGFFTRSSAFTGQRYVAPDVPFTQVTLISCLKCPFRFDIGFSLLSCQLRLGDLLAGGRILRGPPGTHLVHVECSCLPDELLKRLSWWRSGSMVEKQAVSVDHQRRYVLDA